MNGLSVLELEVETAIPSHIPQVSLLPLMKADNESWDISSEIKGELLVLESFWTVGLDPSFDPFC